VAGSCTLGTVNGAGVVEVSTVESGPANECAAAPCSGLSFNITYVVKAATGFTSIDYPSVSTCSPSSVPGTTICVLLRDNLGTPVGENVQPASYGAATPSLISVVVGVNGGLFWSGQYSGAWSNWQSLSGASPSSPGLCASGPGSAELVVRGFDNRVYHKTFSAGTWTTSWDVAPNGATSDQPLCAVLGNTLHVVVRGTDNELWATSFDLIATTWSAWVDLQGASPSPPAIVATVVPGNPSQGTVDIIARGMDDGIYHTFFASSPTPGWSTTWDSSWSGTFQNPSKDRTISTPAVLSRDNNFLFVVVRGSESALWAGLNCAGTHACWNSATPPAINRLTGWTPLSGSSPIAPSLTIDDSTGTIHLVVRGFDNNAYEKTNIFSTSDAGVWDTSWTNLGGGTQLRPAVAMVGSTLGVVVSGFTSELWSNILSGSTLSGWLLLGGATNIDPSLVAVP